MTALTRRTGFLPEFCAVRMAITVILIAELLAIVLTLTSAGLGRESFQTLALQSLFIQWVALGCVAVLCLLRRTLNRLPDLWNALLAYGVMLAVTLTVTEIAWHLFYASPAGVLEARMDHDRFLLRSVGISSIVSALVLRYFYVQHQWLRHVRSEAEARLQALQARIRPHFLFNCMNTIASLTRRQPALAEQAIEDLADLFRLTLHDGPAWITLAEEWDYCQRYLSIEQLRLGDRLKVDWQVGTLPGDACLPALLLQPLVENAVYHGIEPLAEGGCISIRGHRDGHRLTVTIDNPLSVRSGPQEGNRLAQDNVRQRLASAFGEQGSLTLDTATGRYQVQVSLPYKRGPCAS